MLPYTKAVIDETLQHADHWLVVDLYWSERVCTRATGARYRASSISMPTLPCVASGGARVMYLAMVLRKRVAIEAQ
jgi:hypothetical protein